jgi:anaerobic magnesium-protoporphyrin IX monomethyl ester cyclase
MRVYFIYPSIDCPPGINHGIAALSGVLKSKGHETGLLHVCEGLWPIPEPEEIVARVRAFRPDLVAFSVMSQQYQWSARTAEILRSEVGVPMVIGGVHCTMVPEEVVEDAHFDYVCVGEGEFALLELVERLAGGGDPTTVPNMRIPARFAPAGQAISNPVAPFPDLATLPDQDFELFDLDHIVRVKKGWMGMLTSRGCPYKCTYCFNKEIVDRYVEDGAVARPKEYLRHFPVARVIEEIRELKRRHPHISTLIFDDDLFTLNREYVAEFTAAYGASGLGLPYVVNAHVQQFSEEMARQLKESGCMIVKYGLESGSERVRRDVLWRFMTNAQIERSFAAAHKYDLHTSAFVMFGLPFEGREEILETIQLCARIKMGRFRWAIFFPFPGTAGYRIAHENGLIDHEKMARLGNYFDGSCLRFGDAHDLFLEKLGKVFHWYVNAESDWPSASLYRRLVDEVEGWDRDEFERRKAGLHERDRELSEELLEKGIPHYSIRYSHVMAVNSDFVRWERGEMARVGPSREETTYTLD